MLGCTVSRVFGGVEAPTCLFLQVRDAVRAVFIFLFIFVVSPVCPSVSAAGEVRRRGAARSKGGA